MSVRDALVRALGHAEIVLVGTVLLRSFAVLDAEEAVYQPLWLEWTAFALLCVVAVAVAWRQFGDHQLTGAPRWALVGVVLTASAAATAAVPHEAQLSPAHWSWFIVGWFFCAIFAGETFRVVGSVLALHLALVAGQVLLAGPVDRVDIAQFAMRGTLYTGAQVAFSLAVRVMEMAGRRSEEIVAEETATTTARRVADQLMADRRRRHTDVAATVIPLLEGLSSGRLSAADPEVKVWSLVEATRLRRLMAEDDEQPEPLLHELRACVDLAERAGLRVDVAYRGTFPTPDLTARRSLTEPVIAVLARAADHARVTVVGTQGDVTISVVADSPDAPGDEQRERRGDVEVRTVWVGDQVWATARWPAS